MQKSFNLETQMTSTQFTKIETKGKQLNFAMNKEYYKVHEKHFFDRLSQCCQLPFSGIRKFQQGLEAAQQEQKHFGFPADFSPA